VKAPAFISQDVFRLSKNDRAGLKPPREAARSIQVSRFFVEIWERESAPAELSPDIPAIDYGRRLCESTAKFMEGDKLRPIPHHAARICVPCFTVCSRFDLLIIIWR
jgi:hypothetical protein